MRNNKDENKVFIKACKRAGLNVQNKENAQIAEGLVIVDDRGNNYTVNTNGKIKKIGISVSDRQDIYRRIACVASFAKRVEQRDKLKGYKVAKRGRVLKKQLGTIRSGSSD